MFTASAQTFIVAELPVGIIGWVLSLAISIAALIVVIRQRKRTSENCEDLQKRLLQAKQDADHWQLECNNREQESGQLRWIIKRLKNGVILLSPSLETLLINPAAKQLLNLPAELDLKNRSLIEAIRFPELGKAIAAANADEGDQSASIEVPTNDGVRSVQIRAVRFDTLRGHRVLVSLDDQSDARHLDQMRREFIANTSHELKTPLAAIKGYAETVELAIRDDPEAAHHFMRQINTECLRLERLIADMMQLARAQAGKGLLSISDVSVADVIQQSFSSYRPVADAKSITLVNELTLGSQNGDAPKDHDPRVRADAEATLTITNNLIGNALRYTNSGGSVRVGCRDAGKFIAIYVHDTGIGISTAEQERIFERFYRVEKKRLNQNLSADTPFSRDGGTGIGLSIVRELTQALNGEIRLTSEPGQGSRFEVLLPKVPPPTAKHS